MAMPSETYSNVALNRYLLEQIKTVKASIEGQLATLHEMERRAESNQYSWSPSQCLGNDTITVNSHLKEGIYSIAHHETPIYDGVGNVLPRIKKFKSTLVDEQEDERGHIAGLKARREDADVRNYNVRYVMLEDRAVANLLEEFYINIAHRPPYNDPKMAGK